MPPCRMDFVLDLESCEMPGRARPPFEMRDRYGPFQPVTRVLTLLRLYPLPDRCTPQVGVR